MTSTDIRRRFLQLDEVPQKDTDRLSFSFSSEEPVRQTYGTEVLSHAPEAVNLSRLRDGAPVLWQHNPSEVIGVVEAAEVLNGRGRAVIRWGTSEKARQIKSDVEAGVIRNVSVGYLVDEVGAHDANGQALVSRWTPIELSLVSIPADQSVGINRAQNNNDKSSFSTMNYITDISGPSYVPSTSADGEWQKTQDQFSVVRAIQASASNNWSSAGLEREVSQELQMKTGKRTNGFLVPNNSWRTRGYVKGTANAGGNLVQTDLLADRFVDSLRSRMAVAELGATMITDLQGDVAIPRRTGSSSISWIGADDSDSLSESTGIFDQITMSPKTVGALTKFSRLMELQSTPEIEQLIRSDFIEIIAQAIDQACINGSGSSNQPLGILNTTGIGAVAGGTNGAAVTLDNLLDLRKEVGVDNADFGTAGFLTNSKVECALAKLKDSQGAYLLTPYGNEVGSSRVANRRMMVSNNVPSNGTKGSGTGLSSVIYGNFADLLIGMWGALEILVDPYGSNFAKGSVSVRAMQTLDIAVRHPESFAVMSDAIA